MMGIPYFVGLNYFSVKCTGGRCRKIIPLEPNPRRLKRMHRFGKLSVSCPFCGREQDHFCDEVFSRVLTEQPPSEKFK